MPYVSQLIGKPVTDLEGERVGILRDILASPRGDIHHPKIVAIQVKSKEGLINIPYTDVVVLFAPAIPLNKHLQDIQPYKPDPDVLFLVQDILDKQIIDTDGIRVVRVNDLELARIEGCIYVANVDVSGRGLLRRLGLKSVSRQLERNIQPGTPSGMISWENVELLANDQPMRLKVPGAKMTELHPADLAEILSDLSRQEGSLLLDSLDAETVAETLEEVEPDFQASLVEQMPDQRVADVLEEMSPDEAADLLAELPEDRSQQLLELMEDEDAQEVRKLLAYEEDSAGGIMTTEFLAFQPNMTAEEVIKSLRESANEAETIYYLYVTDEAEHLLGVFSLRELVLAKPQSHVIDFMEKRVVSVHLADSQEECAQMISKYNLLAVPVIDDDEKIHGIVTADDALDKIIPTAWKKRLPRLFH